jgi:hypothetical protein
LTRVPVSVTRQSPLRLSVHWLAVTIYASPE